MLLLPHSKRVTGCVCRVYTFSLCTSRYGFFPQSRNMHLSLIGISKLSVGVIKSLKGVLSHLSLRNEVAPLFRVRILWLEDLL